MACNECTQQEPCVKNDCSCPIPDFPTSCIKYTGPDLECSKITSGQNFDEVLQQLDQFICDKFNFISQTGNLINVGGGAEVYKEDSPVGVKELRTILGIGDLIKVEEKENEIEVSIDEDALSSFIGEPQPQETYKVENIPSSEEKGLIYRDSTTTGNETTFNFRKIKSETLIVDQDEEFVTIETGFVFDTKDFIVDPRFASQTYEETGTYAKPYKNLDNAIAAYIDAPNGGTRANPVNLNAKITCIGGGNHSFTSSLSIRGLVLEIEVGTYITYEGSDLYPIDFRTLQNDIGGSGNQTSSLNIKIQGKGILRTRKLLAYVVTSGHTVSSTNRYSNALTISGTRVESYYKEEFFEEGIKRTGGSDWISNTRVASFYFGTINEPLVVAEGNLATPPLEDNANITLVVIEDAGLYSLTQQVLKVDGVLVSIRRSVLTYTFIQGRIIAEQSSNILGTINETPTGTYNLPSRKEGLCIIEMNGTAQVIIEGGALATGHEITRGETWIKMNSDDSRLTMEGVATSIATGGLITDYFINTTSFHPQIEIRDTNIVKVLLDTLIYTTIKPYIKALIRNNEFKVPISASIDLTMNNSVSVINVFNGKIKESLQKHLSRPAAVSSGLTTGDVYILRRRIPATKIERGEEYEIVTIGTTDFTTLGAAYNNVTTVFIATVDATPSSGNGEVYKNRRENII